MVSIEVSSDIEHWDERVRSMALHAEASKFEAIARGMRREADLLEAEIKKRRESRVEREKKEKEIIAPDIYLLAFAGQAMFCLTDVEAFNPWGAGDHLAKVAGYARILQPGRSDPFFFEIDELIDRIGKSMLDVKPLTLEESESFLLKAREFCERYK